MNITRRKFAKQSAALILGAAMNPLNSLHERLIPSSGERIPVIGLGSWLTFDTQNQAGRMVQMRAVLEAFVTSGGTVVDSSPMYGSSEESIGKLSSQLKNENKLWYATKIWTDGKENGLRQMENSQRYFHNRVQLFQIHNLRDFKTFYPLLLEKKEKGYFKYIGITHYVNSKHRDLLDCLQNYPMDFVQCNFNIGNSHAADFLLPGAADKGVAVIVNQPFQTGSLFRQIKAAVLPLWIQEKGVDNWAGYFLKYIISHPAVTCAIPATTQVPHVLENLEAGTGWLPTEKERQRMQNEFLKLI